MLVRNDVDEDGDLDEDDAALILRYVTGGASISETGLMAADVNGDGRVDARDATQLLRYIHGLSSCLDD